MWILTPPLSLGGSGSICHGMSRVGRAIPTTHSFLRSYHSGRLPEVIAGSRFSPRAFRLISTSSSWRGTPGEKVVSPSSILLRSSEQKARSISIVVPQLDFSVLEDPHGWERDLRLRGWTGDFEKVLTTWKLAENVYSELKKYQGLRKQFFRSGKKGDQLEMGEEDSQNRDANLFLDDSEFHELTQKYRAVDKAWTEMLEEGSLHDVFRLPNRLHPCMTQESAILQMDSGSEVLKECSSPSNKSKEASTQFLEKYLLSPEISGFVSPDPLLEQCLPRLMTSTFPEAIPVRNSGFVKSFVLEGCGMPFGNPMQVCTLEYGGDATEDGCDLHLVGGSSLPAFVAAFGKSYLKQNQLPAVYVAAGKVYEPIAIARLRPSLRGLDFGEAEFVETPVGSLFAQTADEAQCDATFAQLLDAIQKMYKSVGIPSRSVQPSAARLNPWEMRRVDVEVKLGRSGGDGYTCVGFLASHGTYISNRLLLRKRQGTKYKPVHTIYGVALDTGAFVGCSDTTRILSGLRSQLKSL